MRLVNKVSLAVLLFARIATAEITTIHSFSEASPQLELSDKDTLVIFDVDDVLIISEDFVLRPSAAGFDPVCWKNKTEEEINYLVSIIQSEMDFILIDPSIPSLIESLQTKGIKTLALTACRTGKFGMIENVEDWRIEQLLDHKIDFTPSWKDAPPRFFSQLVATNQNPPLFKKGILLLGDFYLETISTKGKVLEAFLDTLNWQPKRVLFFDDKIKNLTAVQEVLEKRKIEYHGYLYKGADTMPGSFDKELAEFQIQHLTKHKEWLNETRAKELLSQKNTNAKP